MSRSLRNSKLRIPLAIEALQRHQYLQPQDKSRSRVSLRMPFRQLASLCRCRRQTPSSRPSSCSPVAPLTPLARKCERRTSAGSPPALHQTSQLHRPNPLCRIKAIWRERLGRSDAAKIFSRKRRLASATRWRRKRAEAWSWTGSGFHPKSCRFDRPPLRQDTGGGRQFLTPFPSLSHRRRQRLKRDRRRRLHRGFQTFAIRG